MMFGPTVRWLERGLEAASLRQAVIADNIANVNTPGFKRSVVRFEEFLPDPLRPGQPLRGAVTHPRHLPIGPREDAAPVVAVDGSTAMRPDGNNVDLEREMVRLAENQLMFEALVRRISYEFSDLRMAISGRR